MMTESRRHRGRIAALITGVVLPLGAIVVASPADAATLSISDPVGDLALGSNAAVDITQVEVSHGSESLTVAVTLVDTGVLPANLSVYVDTDGDQLPEFNLYASPSGAAVYNHTDEFSWQGGSVVCSAGVSNAAQAGRRVLSLAAARACLGRPASIRVYVVAAMTGDDHSRDSAPGAPPLEGWNFDWSSPISADVAAAPLSALPPSDQPPVVGGSAKKKGAGVVIKVRDHLLLPAGVTQAQGCHGIVKLKVKRSNRVVAKAKAKVKKTCVYKKKIKIKSSQVGSAKRLKLLATFTGNGSVGRSKGAYTVKVE
ncbi:hypothetical protein [Nocardioides humi]